MILKIILRTQFQASNIQNYWLFSLRRIATVSGNFGERTGYKKTSVCLSLDKAPEMQADMLGEVHVMCGWLLPSVMEKIKNQKLSVLAVDYHLQSCASVLCFRS